MSHTPSVTVTQTVASGCLLTHSVTDICVLKANKASLSGSGPIQIHGSPLRWKIGRDLLLRTVDDYLLKRVCRNAILGRILAEVGWGRFVESI